MTPAPSMWNETEFEFDGFIRTVLKNDRKNYFDYENRRQEREMFFCEFADEQLERLTEISLSESYSFLDNLIMVAGIPVLVEHDELYEALMRLEKAHRDIMLMFFWLEMNDREISEETGINIRKVNRIRHSTPKKLKKLLEEYENE